MVDVGNKNPYLFSELNADQVRKLIAQHKDTVILDVRSPEEYRNSHISGAVNLNVLEASFKQKVTQLDPSKTYIVYCRSGSRSRQACILMATLGFTRLYNLTGGMMEWAD